MGKVSQEIGGELQTEGKPTRRSYSIKVLTQGDMELPKYIEKCRHISDACRWPEDAKEVAFR